MISLICLAGLQPNIIIYILCIHYSVKREFITRLVVTYTPKPTLVLPTLFSQSFVASQ